MRRTIVQSAERTSNGLRFISSVPFICASCRRAVQSPLPQRSQTRRSQRVFSSTAKRLQTSNPGAQRESITPQTHYDFFPQTFPSGLPPHSPFSPDLKQLRKEFLQLQAKAHPDLAPADKKVQAEALSSRINEAYKTLQDPLRRAQYLLSLRGINVEDESAKLDGLDNELLMQVMDAREAVEEVQDEAELVELQQENEARIVASVEVLETQFGIADWEAAAQEAVKLRYWANIEESIRGWEQGKGGARYIIESTTDAVTA